MPEDLPERWLTMPARDRDVLLTLLLDGPDSGIALYERVGGVEGRSSENQHYDSLNRLRDEGLVSRSKRDGRTYDYAITGQGKMLVHRVGEVWEGVLRG